jgi:hypothetical protein
MGFSPALTGTADAARDQGGTRAGGPGGSRAGNIPWSSSGQVPQPAASGSGSGAASDNRGENSATVYKQAAERASPDASMWVALLAGLFFSLCANAYFIWQAWETHNRYEDLVAELADDRGLPSTTTSRRRRDLRVIDDDPDRGVLRGRDESASIA